jgi:hypothetical protein
VSGFSKGKPPASSRVRLRLPAPHQGGSPFETPSTSGLPLYNPPTNHGQIPNPPRSGISSEVMAGTSSSSPVILISSHIQNHDDALLQWLASSKRTLNCERLVSFSSQNSHRICVSGKACVAISRGATMLRSSC